MQLAHAARPFVISNAVLALYIILKLKKTDWDVDDIFEHSSFIVGGDHQHCHFIAMITSIKSIVSFLSEPGDIASLKGSSVLLNGYLMKLYIYL
jgi:hypothetical protein